MKKHSLICFLLCGFLVASCSLLDKAKNIFDKDNKPSENEPQNEQEPEKEQELDEKEIPLDNLESFKNVLEKTLALTNFKVERKVIRTSKENQIEDYEVPVESIIVEKSTAEVDSLNQKYIQEGMSTRTAKISDITAKYNIPDGLLLAQGKTYAIDPNDSFVLDFDNDIFSETSIDSEISYFGYDPINNQDFYINWYDNDEYYLRYKLQDDSPKVNFTIELKEFVDDLLEAGITNFNEFELDEGLYTIKATNDYIKEIKYSDPEYGYEETYTIFDVNTTHVELPKYTVEEHDCENDPYSNILYEEFDNGHRRCCGRCNRFLDKEIVPHNSNNQYGICLDCGHINNESDEFFVPEGFRREDGSYYMVFTCGVGDIYNSWWWSLKGEQSRVQNDELLAAYGCGDQVILITTFGDVEVNDLCISVKRLTHHVYKNIDASMFENLDDDALEELYCNILNNEQPDAEYTHLTVNIYHDEEHETIVINPCTTLHKYTCKKCHEVVYTYEENDHNGNLVESLEYYDEYHKLYTLDCSACGYHYEHIYHFSSSLDSVAIDSAIQLNECYTFYKLHCDTCHEKGHATYTDERHGRELISYSYAIDEHHTKVYNVCKKCGTIVSSHVEENHGDYLTYKWIRTSELSDYGYYGINYDYYYDSFLISYCSLCNEYINLYKVHNEGPTAYAISMDHDFNVAAVTCYSKEPNGTISSHNETICMDHHLNDGICEFCHARIFDYGNYRLMFRYTPEVEIAFIDRTTNIDYFNSIPWIYNDAMAEYDFTQYVEGLYLRIYYGENDGTQPFFGLVYNGEVTNYTKGGALVE